MLYHAQALADEGYDVTLLGYRGHALPADVLGRNAIRVRYLRSPPRLKAGAAGLFVQVLWRGLLQPLELLVRILAARRPMPRGRGSQRTNARPPASILLVQVPPAIPNLTVAALAGRLCGCRIIVDWHNFGWSMLALRARAGSALIGAARAYERWSGTLAHAHLCVSSAMRDVLTKEWKLSPVAVLHDKPADVFLAAVPADLQKLRGLLGHVAGPPSGDSDLAVVTSTSWTADEDMDLLLRALVHLDVCLAGGDTTARVPAIVQPPFLELFATGDGAARADWERRAAAAGLRHVTIRTGWLDLELYACLLASCDVGLSLHRSASGVDLPMKILDMHGARLPVAALDYGPCLNEVLAPEESTLKFRSDRELSLLLHQLLTHAEEAEARLAAAAAAIRRGQGQSWHARWRAKALAMMGEE
ncbi:MAG TPA: hypothetical protein VEC57_20525 [Candidatus Limnocylindrales bacterium]|nr:hypothetical protein [Candidatus Limnocylindrales bacterium]